MALFNLFKKKKSLLESGIIKNCNDHHSHVLFGVDDGVGSLEESLSVLQYMEESGVKELWCTPHIMEDVPNSTEFLRLRFKELKERYHGDIKLHLAAEYMLDTLFVARLEQKDLLTIKDDILLVETSTMAEPYNLEIMFKDIMSAGYIPLYAHPERYRFLQEKDYDKFYRMGVKFQLNLGSVTGFYGSSAKWKAEYLLSKGMYWCCGSDCHKLSTLQHQFSRAELTRNTIKLLHLGITSN